MRFKNFVIGAALSLLVIGSTGCWDTIAPTTRPSSVATPDSSGSFNSGLEGFMGGYVVVDEVGFQDFSDLVKDWGDKCHPAIDLKTCGVEKRSDGKYDFPNTAMIQWEIMSIVRDRELLNRQKSLLRKIVP